MSEVAGGVGVLSWVDGAVLLFLLFRGLIWVAVASVRAKQTWRLRWTLVIVLVVEAATRGTLTLFRAAAAIFNLVGPGHHNLQINLLGLVEHVLQTVGKED